MTFYFKKKQESNYEKCNPSLTQSVVKHADKDRQVEQVAQIFGYQFLRL
jgi:hypothetical protein